ncbi:uncharacterized protein BYT42DRAFT_246429 [Radiomyces spectabilis]|uniref:uncharacterized protein n=1 Tax=Radiomyces spectabilis TaxID=64574 RepID=UPI00221F45F2|nr:uncharacterized protein BYT42DRAFT_246429 [Radiomyces spectabilis]KAI8388774.1 hypothetical protein BYT42DRAFT_246429 [Radiomyces spectabilis]
MQQRNLLRMNFTRRWIATHDMGAGSPALSVCRWINSTKYFQLAGPVLIQNRRFERLLKRVGLPVSEINDVAWLFGLWLGDGTTGSTDIAVNINDVDEIQRIQDVCGKLGVTAAGARQTPSQVGTLGGRVYIRRPNRFRELIKALGMGAKGSKKLETWFETEPISVRENILAGLIDSDRHVVRVEGEGPIEADEDEMECATRNNDMKEAQRLYIQVIIISIYQDLATGVIALARSSSIKFSIGHTEAHVNKYGMNMRFCFRITLMPCSALTNVLSLLSIPYKYRPAPAVVRRLPVEYRFKVERESLSRVLQEIYIDRQKVDFL